MNIIVSNTTPIISLVLDEMISKGRWYSKKVYAQILMRAGEL